MGSGKIFPTHGQQSKAIQPLRPLAPLPPLPKLGQSPTTQRTLPIAGAPRVPANPLLKMMTRFLNKR
jgi:hypothetical protein